MRKVVNFWIVLRRERRKNRTARVWQSSPTIIILIDGWHVGNARYRRVERKDERRAESTVGWRSGTLDMDV